MLTETAFKDQESLIKLPFLGRGGAVVELSSCWSLDSCHLEVTKLEKWVIKEVQGVSRSRLRERRIFFYRQKLGKLEAVVKATVQVLGWSCVIFT